MSQQNPVVGFEQTSNLDLMVVGGFLVLDSSRHSDHLLVLPQAFFYSPVAGMADDEIRVVHVGAEFRRGKKSLPGAISGLILGLADLGHDIGQQALAGQSIDLNNESSEPERAATYGYKYHGYPHPDKR